MPSLKSSTKTGSTLTLFASERRAIDNTRTACGWIAEHAADVGTAKLASEASDLLGAMLTKLNGQPTAPTVT